ncbi:hypothetical protein [Seonamhaeicola sp. ML3]|uniref:hypothetical protein n=1 Tax=Seonamhaeicola sp. ML3 TaxID=2937786 RepID=UPI002010341D|nr:hypothetical protein [Seonamhaeicola sp. ML3]
MKVNFKKISSVILLTLLTTSNVIGIHAFFHDQGFETNHSFNNQNEHDNENEEDTPCDICILAFNINSLDYNTSLEFVYKNSISTQQITNSKALGYVELFLNQNFISKNRNKAPPTLV